MTSKRQVRASASSATIPSAPSSSHRARLPRPARSEPPPGGPPAAERPRQTEPDQGFSHYTPPPRSEDLAPCEPKASTGMSPGVFQGDPRCTGSPPWPQNPRLTPRPRGPEPAVHNRHGSRGRTASQGLGPHSSSFSLLLANRSEARSHHPHGPPLPATAPGPKAGT